ncbi:hypothetical protein M3C81_000505 [Micrococcus luteus]|nr:hypothetical protein [Micrococcus luteus]
MTTTAQITEWADANHGKCIDRDNRYGAQAPDLVNAYAQDLYDLLHVFGHGKDMAANLARVHGWEEIGPDEHAKLGDVFSSIGDGLYGFCGVVILDLGAKLVVFVQNANGTGEDPASFQLISKADVIGYARPPVEA